MYYDIHTDRQTDRHRTLLGTAPCTSKSSYSNTSWYTFHLTFFFLWYFLILVPFQLAKKNMDLASLKNELSQSEARLTEQVCTLFSTSFSIFSCSHFAFLCLAQLNLLKWSLQQKPLFILEINKAGRLRLHSIFEHLCWSWSLGALQFRVCMVLQKIILLVCLNFQFLLNEQNAEATNTSERTSNLQYQLGVAQVSMKCNWVSIVQFLGLHRLRLCFKN